MLSLTIGLLLITLALAALALQRFYSTVPAKELKRLAGRGDHLAQALYRPVSHGASLRLLLWLVFCLSLAGGLLLILLDMPPLMAFLALAASAAAAALIQSLRLTIKSAHFAAQASPALSWLLNYLHTPFDFITSSTNRLRHHTAHSGLYEKEDLLDLLQQQKNQPDNRLSEQDLELLSRAARFGDRQAADIVLAMSRVKLVKTGDHIGPVLLGELHSSGQDSFLVYDGTPDRVVGTLFLRDAVAAKEGGTVRQLMHPRLSFVHEDFSLSQVLTAFARTGQFMVVVVNNFEEPVGVITLSHLLTQLIGEQNQDDFDAFENRSAVAAYRPKQPEPEETIEEVQPSPEATEVIE
jgi:CBS domain containing-hemolysin-like protein